MERSGSRGVLTDWGASPRARLALAERWLRPTEGPLPATRGRAESSAADRNEVRTLRPFLLSLCLSISVSLTFSLSLSHSLSLSLYLSLSLSLSDFLFLSLSHSLPFSPSLSVSALLSFSLYHHSISRKRGQDPVTACLPCLCSAAWERARCAGRTTEHIPADASIPG